MAEDLGFSDFKELRLLRRDGARACAAWVADGTWAIVVDHGPKHVGEFGLVLWLHVKDAGDRSQVGDVEEAVVRGAVIPREAGAVHAEGDIQVLQGDVVNDHVIRALHEGAVDGDERFQTPCGHAAGEEGCVLLGDADIVAARGMALGEVDQACAGRHGGCDGDDLVIVVGEICELRAEKFGVGRGG